MIQHAGQRNIGTIISPPGDDMAFLWGQHMWGKNSEPEHPEGIIKVSLHKYEKTVPMPYGFIVEIGSGGILRAYDYEVTEFSKIEGHHFQYFGLFNDFRVYNENELNDLMKNTSIHGSNEIWVSGRKARIVGAYIFGEDSHRGLTIFKFKMKRAGIPLCLMY